MDSNNKNNIKDWIIVALFFGTIFVIIGLLSAWDNGKLDGTGIENLLSMLVPSIGVGVVIVLIVNMWDYIINGVWAIKGKIYFLIYIVSTVLACVYISCKPSEDEYLPILSILLITLLVTVCIRTIVFYKR